MSILKPWLDGDIYVHETLWLHLFEHALLIDVIFRIFVETAKFCIHTPYKFEFWFWV